MKRIDVTAQDFNLIKEGLKTCLITPDCEFDLGLVEINNKEGEDSLVCEVVTPSSIYSLVGLQGETWLAVSAGYSCSEALISVLKHRFPNRSQFHVLYVDTKVESSSEKR